MTRGTVSLFLIIGGVVLLVIGVFGSPLFLATPEPGAGGVFGIALTAVGVVLLIAGIVVRWTQPKR